MDTVFAILNWLATVEGMWSILRITGMPWLAKRWLRKMGGPVMVTGLEFFPTRAILDRARDYDELLARAEKIDAAYTTGQVLTDFDIANIRHIRRLILPDPRSESLVSYAISIGNSPDLQRQIIRATQDVRENYGIDVRWYPGMYHASFNIGDADKNNGWAHVELTLPFSKPNRRPSFTISKAKSEETVAGLAHVFEEMWKASQPPDEAYLAEQEAKPVIDI